MMKKNSLIPKTKRSSLFSLFPVALFAAFGYFAMTTPQSAPEINPNGILQDTLPGDTTDDPIPSDTMGYPGDDPTEDTSAYPSEDYFPADTTDQLDESDDLDTAGSGGLFGDPQPADDPMPADTNGFNR